MEGFTVPSFQVGLWSQVYQHSGPLFLVSDTSNRPRNVSDMLRMEPTRMSLTVVQADLPHVPQQLQPPSSTDLKQRSETLAPCMLKKGCPASVLIVTSTRHLDRPAPATMVLMFGFQYDRTTQTDIVERFSGTGKGLGVRQGWGFVDRKRSQQTVTDLNKAE